MDVVGAIMDFESGELDAAGVLELFADLIKTGTAWSLQGSYGRSAKQLIDDGWISTTGEILRSPEEEI